MLGGQDQCTIALNVTAVKFSSCFALCIGVTGGRREGEDLWPEIGDYFGFDILGTNLDGLPKGLSRTAVGSIIVAFLNYLQYKHVYFSANVFNFVHRDSPNSLC